MADLGLTFQFPNGQPVANGYIVVRLSADGASSDGQIYSQIGTRLLLDENGNIIGDGGFTPNTDITPANTSYLVTAYSATGQFVLGPVAVTVDPGVGLEY